MNLKKTDETSSQLGVLWKTDQADLIILMYTTWTKKEHPIQVYAAIYVMETTVQVGITLMRRHWFIRMNETPWRPRILPFQSDKVVRRDLVLGFPILTLHRLRLHNCTSIEESERKIGPWKRLQRLTRSSNAFRCRRYVTESAVKKKEPSKVVWEKKNERATGSARHQLLNAKSSGSTLFRRKEKRRAAEWKGNQVELGSISSARLRKFDFLSAPTFWPFPTWKKIVKSF